MWRTIEGQDGNEPEGLSGHHITGCATQDFFSQEYFDSWLEVARNRPRTLFYGYTKSLPFWVARTDSVPANLVLTASRRRTPDAPTRHPGPPPGKVVPLRPAAAPA